MTHLSVNINKIATLRNARGGSLPNVVQFAQDCEKYGADGITIHPRPDERHITTQDVYDLSQVVKTEFNIEGYPDERFLTLVEKIKPHQVTLVPDPPHVLTSNAGWDTQKDYDFLKKVIARLKESDLRVSLFMETEELQISLAKELGADRIEFYTGPYADHFKTDREAAIEPYVYAGQYADSIGLGINAGHDLNLENLSYFMQNVPSTLEVSIGHALVSDALYFGLEKTIELYQAALQPK